MLIDIGLIALGLIGLYFGGEWLVKAAARLALSYGVPAVIIGLTIVSIGTSMPELVVSVSAALGGSSDIALGNVIGSNIANIGLILGISGLILPLTIHESLIRREIPVMIGVSIVMLLMALDGAIGRIEGLLLLLGYALFVYFLYRTSSGNHAADEIESEVGAIEGEPLEVNRRNEFGRTAVGIALLVVGAQLTVTGAVSLARQLGVSELVIGITLVAVGTSLPEIATSTVAAMRRHSDIAVGNVVGSNIANILIIMGTASLIRPVGVNPALYSFEFPVMIGFAVILFPFVLGRTLQRYHAVFFLTAYVTFIVLTAIHSGMFSAVR